MRSSDEKSAAKTMNINEPRRSKRRPLENAKDFFFFFFLTSAETRAECRRCQESVQAALIVNARLKAARKVLLNCGGKQQGAPKQNYLGSASHRCLLSAGFYCILIFPWKFPTVFTQSRNICEKWPRG